MLISITNIHGKCSVRRNAIPRLFGFPGLIGSQSQSQTCTTIPGTVVIADCIEKGSQNSKTMKNLNYPS